MLLREVFLLWELLLALRYVCQFKSNFLAEDTKIFLSFIFLILRILFWFKNIFLKWWKCFSTSFRLLQWKTQEEFRLSVMWVAVFVSLRLKVCYFGNFKSKWKCLFIFWFWVLSDRHRDRHRQLRKMFTSFLHENLS